MSIGSSLGPVAGVLGSCGCGGEGVSRSGPLLLFSNEGGGCCVGWLAGIFSSDPRGL